MTVFFARCKPYGIDAIELARDNCVVFLGYPLKIAGADQKHNSIHQHTVDLFADDQAWFAAKEAVTDADYDFPVSYKREAQSNRNLARDIKAGDIAVLPDAKRGVAYVGEVIKGFELLDSPPWLKQFEEILQENRKGGLHEDDWDAAEVAQVFRVRSFVKVPLLELGHYNASLRGRRRFGRISDPEADTFFGALIRGERRRRPWTLDHDEVKQRIRQEATPTDFEYLMVSLLQLEQPDRRWRVVGGSGDGGADGVAADDEGKPVAVLQCKLRYHGEDVFGAGTRGRNGDDVDHYLAAMFHVADPAIPSGVRFLDADEVARLVISHHQRLPAAISWRIGQEHRA
jgi:hypothetical protein